MPFLNLIQGYFVPSSITCVNSMEVSYIPIAKARGFTTHWITTAANITKFFLYILISSLFFILVPAFLPFYPIYSQTQKNVAGNTKFFKNLFAHKLSALKKAITASAFTKMRAGSCHKCERTVKIQAIRRQRFFLPPQSSGL